MKIAATGFHGLIVSELRKRWEPLGYQFLELERSGSDQQWIEILKESQVILNFAGASIARRWTQSNRKKILESRIHTTRRLVKLLNNLPVEKTKHHRVLISASAIGIYPNAGDHSVDEFTTSFGTNFLSEVVKLWELEINQLSNPSIRCVIVRLGVVLAKQGGMLKKVWPIFRLGFGGTFGNGNQVFSFIHIDDLVKAFDYFINQKDSKGVYNLVAPKVSTNREFSNELAKAANRRLLFSMPASLIRLMLGEASEMLLKGEWVYPRKLINENFNFLYPNIQKVFRPEW